VGLAAGTAGDIRPLELDVLRQESTNAAVAAVLAEQPALDVVVHNAGHVFAHEAGVVTPFTDPNRRTEHA
jgi:NAD(P)-dependent dehydrogenase (short-subunit alcohol dehydrogenase family)